MIRVLSLLETGLLRIGRYDHPPEEEHHDPAEELARDYSVSFVERGRFSIEHVRQKEALAQGSVILTRPGMQFRCSHSEARPDDVCLCVSFRDHTSVESAIEGGSRKDAVDRGFVARSSNRLSYLYIRLARMLARRAEAVALETLAGEILTSSFHGRDTGDARRHSPAQLAWYAERVEFARQLLEEHPEAQHSLDQLASRVHMSPFHFARVFRALAGQPPHRYLLDIRLSRSAALLRSGISVTEACYQSGFNNLSHFSRCFRRRFGVPPSRLVH